MTAVLTIAEIEQAINYRRNRVARAGRCVRKRAPWLTCTA